MLAPVWLGVAALLVGLMGIAVQRGATCMVAAVDELLAHRRGWRALAMLEAGIWVGGILALATLAGVDPLVPAPRALSRATLVGGVLLGLGAWINRACVFGAIARLGSGEWAFLFTPLGFFAGCKAAYLSGATGIAMMDMNRAAPLPPPLVPFMGLLLAGLVGWRLLVLWRAPQTTGMAAAIWHDLQTPRSATALIGICFAILLLFAGPWTYPEALAGLAATNMLSEGGERALLFVALLAGAMAGGWQRGRTFSVTPRAAACLRCFAGGFVMALGSLIVPGSNDGLLLLGLPLLWPYAMVSLLVMCLTIAAAELTVARVRRSLSAVAG